MLILASNSETRRAMLTAAGVLFEVVAPRIDEEAAKASLRAQGLSARNLADALAELKACRVSANRSGDIILGCDQTLALSDGTMLDKPGANLAVHLRSLSGQTHSLYSAIVAVENGRPIWRHVDRAVLTMRSLTEDFISDYADHERAGASDCVGGYRIEGIGIQLFSKIEGSHFTILGLPLLPLLDWLRARKMLTA